MNYDRAVKWLKAIGGSHEVVPDADGRETVIASAVGITKGERAARAAFEGKCGGYAREIDFRKAFTSACDALKSALD